MVQSVELIDRGLSAYTRGLVTEAAQCWREALALEPGNERAIQFLALLDQGPSGAAPPVDIAMEEFEPSPWDDGPSLSPTMVLDSEGGIDLAAIDDVVIPKAAPLAPVTAFELERRNDSANWMEGARELFALGDFSGSLEMLEKILHVDPNHADALKYLQQNEATLVQMYESKLGPLTGVPRLAIKPEEVMWLNLDHRAGFLLAEVDGKVTLEDLFDLSGLSRLETARILAGLIVEGVIRT